jgi:hypothetical protein
VSGRGLLTRFAGAGGSVLLEVLLATLLVSVLVAPLAASFGAALRQARVFRAEVAAIDPRIPSRDVAASWEWGPRVISGWWRPGPVLHLRLSGDGGLGVPQSCLVGLWIDGWPLGERKVDFTGGDGGGGASNDLQIEPAQWSARADRELIVRVRAVDGAWGPPWRLAVPEATAAGPATGLQPAAPPGEDDVVAHRPSAAGSGLTTSWSSVAVGSAASGGPFVLAAGIKGWAGAALDGRWQWWWMEDERSVDIFF